jgi:hypothetical protein
MSNAWDSSQEVYKEYVNVDPEVDLESDVEDPAERKLATLVTPIDSRIEELSRLLDVTDYYPGEEWFEDLFAEHSWVSGALVVDLDGEVMIRRPEVSMKPVLTEPLIKDEDLLRDRRIKGYIQDSPLGPEIYMASPFFSDGELRGVVAVHFDIRNLTGFASSPEELVVFAPESMLWPGGYEDLEFLTERPWEEILEDDVSGEIDHEGKRYLWASRYLGDMSIVYAVGSEEEAEGGFWFF